MESLGTFGKVAIILIIILLLIWILHTSYKTGYMPDGVFRESYESMVLSANRQYDKYFESPETLYTKTIGYNNDDVAKTAISKAERLERSHETNELNGTTAESANNAAVNAFILGDLYRYNVAPALVNTGSAHRDANEKASKYYRKALRRITQYAPLVVEQNVRVDQPTPEHIVDRLQQLVDDPDIILNADIQRDIIAAQNRIRGARVNAPRAGHKDAAVATYFERRDVRNDPQNVHDSNITQSLKHKYDKILESNANADLRALATTLDEVNYLVPSKEQIETALNDSTLDDKKKRKARNILKHISPNNSISSLGTDEETVLLETWRRIHSPDNVAQKTNLRVALFDSLASAIEENSSGEQKVCVTGRCGRIIDSLTLLDSSKDLSEPVKTTEILRNEIMMKAHKVFQDELKKAPQDIQNVYNGTVDTAPMLEAFKADAKKAIHDSIVRDYPEGTTAISNIINDAKAGIDI